MKKAYKLEQFNTNKNSSLNESKMKISLDDKSKTKSSKSQNKNKVKNSKKGQKVTVQTQTGEEQKDNLSILKEKNSTLESNLNKIKFDLDIERNNVIQESNNLNLKISKINNEINRLRLDNKYITNNLYSIQKKLETKINKNMHTKMRSKSGEVENNTKDKLNKNIILKEKMILNSKQNLKMVKKEKELLENEIKKIGGVDKESLEKKLEDIKKIKNEEIKELEKLKNIQSEHGKICVKKISELLRQYDLIKKEYEFEIKKCNFINEKNNSSTLKNITSKSSGNVLTNASSNNIISKNKNIRNKKLIIYNDPFKENDYQIFNYILTIKNEKNKKDDLPNINDGFLKENKSNIDIADSQSKFVSNSINYTNTDEQNNNRSMIYQKLNNSSIQNRNYELFTKSEKLILSKLIPKKFLNNCEQKFDLLQKENNNLKIKMNNSASKKKINRNNNILELENNNLKNNILNKKEIFLNSKISEYQRKKKEINDKIKENQKNIDYYQILYKKKNKEFNILLREYKRIYDDIKNGKLYLKKGAQLTEKNIQAMHKYGMNESDNTSFNGNDDVDNINYSEDEDNEKIEKDEDEQNNEN